MVVIKCVRCKKDIEVDVTIADIERFKTGTSIQKAMPNTPPEQRELFLSGLCGVCWNEIFKE